MTTYAVVAAGEFNEGDFSKRANAGTFDSIMAVDAGYSYIMNAGFSPDVVLGDFDSLGFVPKGQGVKRYPTHKDKSDLELAFDYMRKRECDAVYVYGVLGGRLDHTLGNLQISAKAAESGLSVEIVGDDVTVRVLVGPATYEIPALAEGIVSVFSAVDESSGVSERGMEYPLDDAVLSNRTTLGLSNELIGRPASVSLRSGTIYVFHPIGV